MKFLRGLIGFFLSFYFLLSFSQHSLISDERKEAEAIMDTLCSNELAGRGYVEDGHVKAANYLATKFQQYGLSLVDSKDSFFQRFALQINLAQKGEVKLDDDYLHIGHEYIIDRFSGTGKGKYAVEDIGYGLSEQKGIENKVLLLREGWPDSLVNDAEARAAYENRQLAIERVIQYLPQRPAGAIVQQAKLTAGFAKQSFPFPFIDILTDSLPTSIDSVEWEIYSNMEKISSQNVIGYLPGKRQPDSVVIICAHYDHMGKQGTAIFPGANDNASGIAMLLSLIKYAASIPAKKRIPMLFIAFGGEETGLSGSRYFVEEDPWVPLQSIKFVLNLDLMGNGDEGMVAIAGYEFPAYFDLLERANEKTSALPKINRRKNRPNSDHFYFVQHNVPAFFLFTLGGAPYYHDVNDKPAHVPLDDFDKVRKLLIAFLTSILEKE